MSGEDVEAGTQQGRTVAESGRPRVYRHHGLVRLTHWLNAICLTGMIASGLQIYLAFPAIGSAERTSVVPNPLENARFPEAITLGGWLAGAINWHFALAWPFVITGLIYLGYLIASGAWRELVFLPRDIRPAIEMQLYYLGHRKEHPAQGKHNALQKGAYTFIVALGAISVLSGFAIYKPVQLAWLVALFGGFELARYWHFVAVWLFTAFTLVHVVMVLLADRASLPSIITGWYRGRFPSHG